MLISDVDIEIIYKLLKSVPDGMEVTSIDLSDGYSLNLKAGTEQINKIEYEEALKNLRKALKAVDNDMKSLKSVT